MLKLIKSFFGLDNATEKQVNETLSPAMTYDLGQPAEAQPVTEVKADPVAVALDLEPMDFSKTAEVPAKKPRKPRAPKAAAEKPAKAVKAKKPTTEKKKPAARTAKKTK
jgi:hypothetical protein